MATAWLVGRRIRVADSDGAGGVPGNGGDVHLGTGGPDCCAHGAKGTGRSTAAVVTDAGQSSRMSYTPGQLAQRGLHLSTVAVLVGGGHAGRPLVLVIAPGYSRILFAFMISSRRVEEVVAGNWQLRCDAQRVPRAQVRRTSPRAPRGDRASGKASLPRSLCAPSPVSVDRARSRGRVADRVSPDVPRRTPSCPKLFKFVSISEGVHGMPEAVMAKGTQLAALSDSYERSRLPTGVITSAGVEAISGQDDVAPAYEATSTNGFSSKDSTRLPCSLSAPHLPGGLTAKTIAWRHNSW